MLAEGQATRLIPVRVADGPPTGLVPALQFVAPTPARVLGLLPQQLSARVPQDRLADVAANLPRSLIVIGARHLTEAVAVRPNVVAVTAMPDAATQDAATQVVPIARADVAVPLTAREPLLIVSARRAGAEPEDIAVARVLALAARIVAVRPDLDGAGLKAHLLSFAKPLPPATPQPTSHGWLPDVARIHWLD